MIQITKKSGLIISKEHKQEQFYKNIINDLTRTYKDFQTQEIKTNKFYVETDTQILIPRYYPIDSYLNSKVIISDQCPEGKDINITSNIELRDGQEEIIHYILINNNGVIQVPPGSGKTVMSIYAIAKLKKKTIIVVHKDSLAEQWKERIIQFTNLNENNIIRLTSKNYKNALDSYEIIIITVQTFISLLKSVKNEDFIKRLYEANIGIFFGDEVHTSVGAPLFSLASLFIPSNRTYGLSATPYRYDNNEDIIEYHLGKVFIPEKFVAQTMEPEIHVLIFDYGIGNKRKYLYVNFRFQKTRYLNLLKKSKKLIEACNTLLDKLYKENKDIIFICDRINVLEELKNNLNHDDYGLFISGATNNILKKKIIFSTSGKIRDGVDCPWKDTLIMASPISNVEQAIGRVQRTAINKNKPLVIDMVDSGCKETINYFFNRKTFYENKKWNIKYYHIGKQIREMNEEEAINFLKH